MTDTELDAEYTRLCEAMSAAGQAQAPLLLARFALLAMVRIDDATSIARMIDEAVDGLNGSAAQGLDDSASAAGAQAREPGQR